MIPAWAAILVAIIGIIPGVLALWRQTRKDERRKSSQERAQDARVAAGAIEGYAAIVEDLRKQARLDNRRFEKLLQEEKVSCEKKIGELLRRIVEMETQIEELKGAVA